MSIPTLEAAFHATTYRVETPGRCFDLRIGKPDPVFDDFLRAQGVSFWGILTACNPGAVQLPVEENQHRQDKLLARLSELGCKFLAACNIPDGSVWPEEPSCLILQADEEMLRALAGEFSQLAAVCGDVGSTPCLLWF
jgi:hypothetical protein